VQLPPTLVFDYPTPADLAAHLGTVLGSRRGPDTAQQAVDLVRAAADGLDDAALAVLAERLRDLVREWDVGAAAAGDRSIELASASAEELFDLLDEQLGTS
jgi:hypothetical protein